MQGRQRRGRRAGAAIAAAATSAALLAACAGEPGAGAGGPGRPRGMKLTSPAFRPGGAIPDRHSCEGENVPPPLRWEGTPAGTRELALVVEDPDAPDEVFVHWVVVGIDPGTMSLEPGQPLPGATTLPGSSDNATYIGPCPPDGDGPHRYSFEVYALGSPPRAVPAGRPREAVRAIREAAVAGGRLVGTFER